MTQAAQHLRWNNLAASGSLYGKSRMATKYFGESVNLLFTQALHSPTFRMLLDRTRIYSEGETSQVSEFGKPITDKWTLHRVISEIRGILMQVMSDDRIFFLSLLLLFLFYLSSIMINWMQIGDEYDLMRIKKDIDNVQLQMEIVRVKRLELALVREISKLRQEMSVE